MTRRARVRLRKRSNHARRMIRWRGFWTWFGWTVKRVYGKQFRRVPRSGPRPIGLPIYVETPLSRFTVRTGETFQW